MGAAVESRHIETMLLQHSHVKDALVLAPVADSPEQSPIVYVAADLGRMKALAHGNPGSAHTGIVDRWNKLYDLTYATGPVAPTFVGWNCSYTRRPIPESEMQEWLQTSLTRIRALKPGKVLEIGCGVGLMLQHLAPQCSRYVATDFSESAITRLGQWIAQRDDLQQVELLHRSAPDLHDMASGTFDTVILNSVVQYFPDIDYLLAVLQEAARLLTPGGNIFVGDVRHLGLLSTFHSAVQLARAADDVSVRELRRRTIRAQMQETELVLDPAFFENLPGCLPGIGGVEVQLRRGHARNELTRYRYDALLRGCGQRTPPAPADSIDWSVLGSCAETEAAIGEHRWSSVCLHSIPNQRLAADVAAHRLISARDLHSTAKALRRFLSTSEFSGIDPEKFWEWGEKFGYEVSVVWGSADSPGSFKVYLCDSARAASTGAPAACQRERGPWDMYANDPQENCVARSLILQLRLYLEERLPDSRLPTSWTVLKDLPCKEDGSVDRLAL